MIKEAIDRIIELSKPATFIDSEGLERFQNGHVLGTPSSLHEAAVCSSLKSLCEFAKDRITRESLDNFFEITGPASVSLIEINEYDGQEKKELKCNCKAILPEPFPFGRFLEIEDFIIRSCDYFINTNAYKDVISTVWSVTDFSQTDVDDDGLSQTVTVKSGIGRKDRKTVSPFHTLQAYRTFREINQPESRYLLRIQKGSQPQVGLFEASGYSWKVDAIEEISKFISKEIPAALVMK